jgi:uncharacterized membrane protein
MVEIPDQNISLSYHIAFELILILFIPFWPLILSPTSFIEVWLVLILEAL